MTITIIITPTTPPITPPYRTLKLDEKNITIFVNNCSLVEEYLIG